MIKVAFQNVEIGVNMSKDLRTKKTPYNIKEAKVAQKKYCQEKGLPLFAPVDGVCWGCYRNIYSCVSHKDSIIPYHFYYTGITAEQAGKFHITGCPHCNKSFCD